MNQLILVGAGLDSEAWNHPLQHPLSIISSGDCRQWQPINCTVLMVAGLGALPEAWNHPPRY